MFTKPPTLKMIRLYYSCMTSFLKTRAERGPNGRWWLKHFFWNVKKKRNWINFFRFSRNFFSFFEDIWGTKDSFLPCLALVWYISFFQKKNLVVVLCMYIRAPHKEKNDVGCQPEILGKFVRETGTTLN